MYNVFSLLQNTAENNPDKIYVVDKDTNWSYRQIFHKTIALAGYIIKCGVNSGDRILIYLDNSVEYIVAFFASLLVNGIVVPVNKNTMLDNIQFIIRDTNAKLIISNNAFGGRLLDIVNTNLSEPLNIDSIFNKTIDSDQFELLNQINTDNDLPAMILYTSGTTKMPKGVTLSHKNLIANTDSILQYLKLESEDSILATINFSYSYGNSILLTHTAAGGKIIIENRIAYPIKIIEQLYSTQVTGFSTVGSYINTLLKQESLKDFHLKSLRYITFAGESTSFEDILKLNRLAPHIKIFVMYGQTEASARLSYLEPSMLFSKPGSIGKGIPGVVLRVVNENEENVEPGQVGEIIAFGDNIMIKYWNNEAETQSIIKNGWLYTNDLATVDEDGFIYVKGRKDDIIKYMGHRISPAEIEAVINTCKFVLESAVIGIGVNENKQIKAYIVTTTDDYEIEELATHIKRLLPPFKRPHIIEIIEEIPRTSNGKIKRSELRERQLICKIQAVGKENKHVWDCRTDNRG